VTSHAGFFAQANGGTLFLDEVGELRLDVQAKLLRVLQDQQIQPLGSSKVENIDVRVVAATHRDLVAEVKAGRFREDLYYRLNVVELIVPPLRERSGDIPLLAREFARRYSERFGLGYVVQLAPELVEYLEHQPWPGNVRQLENTIARCVALATTKIVGLEALEPATSPRTLRRRRVDRTVVSRAGRGVRAQPASQRAGGIGRQPVGDRAAAPAQPRLALRQAEEVRHVEGLGSARPRDPMCGVGTLQHADAGSIYPNLCNFGVIACLNTMLLTIAVRNCRPWPWDVRVRIVIVAATISFTRIHMSALARPNALIRRGGLP